MVDGRTGDAGEGAALAVPCDRSTRSGGGVGFAIAGGRTGGAGKVAVLAAPCDLSTSSGGGVGFATADGGTGGAETLGSTVAFGSATSGFIAIRCAIGSAETGGIGASGNELGFINSARSPVSTAAASIGADSRTCSPDMRIQDALESIAITSATGRLLDRAGSGLVSSNRNSQATLSTICGGTGRTPSE